MTQQARISDASAERPFDPCSRFGESAGAFPQRRDGQWNRLLLDRVGPQTNPVTRLRRSVAWLMVVVLMGAIAACGGEAKPEVGYKPPLLPVKLVVSKDGVSIEGDKSFATPIGTFSIGAQYSLPQRPEETIYVVVRDRNRGPEGSDTIFRVKTGVDKFSAVVNGTTKIEVQDGTVLIDITDGSIDQIEFKRSESTITEVQDTGWWHNRVAAWNAGWDASFYTPFMFSRWAYDDSTISDWWGLGFIWFLLRLLLALLLGLVDIVFTVVFLIAQVAYNLFGPTGSNIVWGLALIIVLGMVWAGLAA